MTNKNPKEWTLEETLAVVQVMAHKATEEQQLLAHRAVGSLLKECINKNECTAIAELIHVAKHNGSIDETGMQQVDDEWYKVEGLEYNYQTAHFSIDYTVGGSDGVTYVDIGAKAILENDVVIGEAEADNEIPDFVELLGIWLEYYLGKFRAYGFPDPIPVGSKQQVIVKSMGSQTWPGGPIIINNYLGRPYGSHSTGYNNYYEGLGVTPGHELFHQVQYQYNDQMLQFLRMYKEGTARWSEDTVNDAYNRYIRPDEMQLYLNYPNTNTFGVLNRYGSVLFWKYMTEQHTNQKPTDIKDQLDPRDSLSTQRTAPLNYEPFAGIDVMQGLWNNLRGVDTEENGIRAIDKTIKDFGGEGLRETFANFAVANWVKDLGDPYIDPKYDYLEDEQANSYSKATYASVKPVGTAVLGGAGDESTFDSTADDEDGLQAIAPWGVSYFDIAIKSNVATAVIEIDAADNFETPFYRIIAVKDNRATIYKGEGKTYTKTLTNRLYFRGLTSFDRVIVVVGAYETGGDYLVKVKAKAIEPETQDDIDIKLTDILDVKFDREDWIGLIELPEPFIKGIEPVQQWTPPNEDAIYVIGTMSEGAYDLLYVGYEEELSDPAFYRSHPKYNNWMKLAGSEENLYIGHYVMPSKGNVRHKLKKAFSRKLIAALN